MRSKAWRRHHLRRIKKRAIKIIRFFWDWEKDEATEYGTKYANSLKNCSCDICSNHGNEASKREKRSIDDVKQQLCEYYESIEEKKK